MIKRPGALCIQVFLSHGDIFLAEWLFFKKKCINSQDFKNGSLCRK